MNESAVLKWLEAHGAQVLIQDIPRRRRKKNRIILQYRTLDGQVEAVGGVTIAAAVGRASLREQTATAGNDNETA